MSHIFISYKTQERDFAYQVRDQLEAWGFTTWIDETNLVDREQWMVEIDQAICSAFAVIAITTPLAISSRYVIGEWDLAIINNVPLIQVVYQTIPPSTKYNSIPKVDFTQKNGSDGFDDLKILIEDLKKKPGTHQTNSKLTYLRDLYGYLSTLIGQLTITTLATYGVEGARSAEPLRLDSERLDHEGNVTHQSSQPVSNISDTLWNFKSKILLLGEPGSGKTVTLLNHARDIITAGMQNTSTPLPILGTIATWNPDTQPAIEDWLSKQSNSPHNTQALIKQGQALLLLDGLDELGSSRPVDSAIPEGDKYDPRERFLNKLEPISQNNGFVMTCRREDYKTITSTIEFDQIIVLKPMSDLQIAQYLRDQQELYELIKQDTALHQIATTPLLLSLFAFTYEDMTEEERRDLLNVNHIGDIRDKIFLEYLEKRYLFEQEKLEHSGTSLSFSLDDTRYILQELAMTNAGTPNHQENVLSSSKPDTLYSYGSFE